MRAITVRLSPPPVGTAAARLMVALVLAGCVWGCRSAQMDASMDASTGAPPAGATRGESAPAVGSTADTGARKSPSSATEALRNTLRWKTASEVDNFGFDVYRGDSEDGPFERLTEQPIPGAGTTDEPQEYVFVDDTIEAGEVYWYYIESISMLGVRERFTPVFKAKAKGPGESSAGASDDPARSDPEGTGGDDGV